MKTSFFRDRIVTINEKLRAASPTPPPVAPLTLSQAEIAEIEKQLGVSPRPRPRVIAVPA